MYVQFTCIISFTCRKKMKLRILWTSKGMKINILIAFLHFCSFLVNPDDDIPVNEQSLFAEMGDSNAFEFSG